MTLTSKGNKLQKIVRDMIARGEFSPKTYNYSVPLPKANLEKLQTHAKANGLKIRKPKAKKVTSGFKLQSTPEILQVANYATPRKISPPMLTADEMIATIESAKKQKIALIERVATLREKAKAIYSSALVGKKRVNLAESVIDNLLSARLRKSKNELSHHDSVFILSDEQTESLKHISATMAGIGQQIRGLSAFLNRHSQYMAKKNESLSSRKQKATKAEKKQALLAEKAKLQTLLAIQQRIASGKIADEILQKAKKEKERVARVEKVSNGFFYVLQKLSNGEIRIESSNSGITAFSNIRVALKAVQLDGIIPATKNSLRQKQFFGVVRDYAIGGLILESNPTIAIVQSHNPPEIWPKKPYILKFK